MSKNKVLDKINQFFRYLNSTWWGSAIIIVVVIVFIFLLLSPIIFPGLRISIIDAQNVKSNPHEKDFLTLYITLIGAVGIFATIWYNARRIDKQQEQITLQREANIDQRFALAVETLGNESESARMGAIYSLYHLAIENNKYRQSVMDILCSHVRSKTREKKYIIEHYLSPSNEIQSVINLLFKKNGVYYKYYNDLKAPILNNCHLNGIDFKESICPEIDLSNSSCYNSNFNKSILHYSKFNLTNINNSDFSECIMPYAQFINAKCINTFFNFSLIPFSSFTYAFCCNADFSAAHLHGSNFTTTQMQYATLENTNMMGVICSSMNITDSKIDNLKLQGAHSQDFMFPFVSDKSYFDLFLNRLDNDSDLSKLIIEAPAPDELSLYLKLQNEFCIDNKIEGAYNIIIEDLCERIKRNSSKRIKIFKISFRGIETGILSLKDNPELDLLIDNNFKYYYDNYCM